MPKRRPTGHAEQIEALLAQASALPHGPTRVDLCEEACRIADLHGDPELSYQAREELVEAACFGGRPDLLIVGFSWCLAAFDKDPEGDFSAFQLLWRMKWVMSALPKFPEIELATIHKMLDDMEARFREYASSVQPVVGERRSVALMTGDFEAAAAAHRQFMKMPRTFLSDCHACELDALAGYWMDIGRTTLGVRKAEDLINSGMRCARVPDTTYGDVLLPMVKLGRAKEAMKYHKKGYPLVRRNVDNLWQWGEHMAFLALTGNDAAAVKALQTHLPDVEGSHDPLGALAFYRNALLTLECVAERKEKIKFRLPAQSPWANESGEHAVADLADKVRGRAAELSQRFDQRNGNKYYAYLLDQTRKIRRHATRVPANA